MSSKNHQDFFLSEEQYFNATTMCPIPEEYEGVDFVGVMLLCGVVITTLVGECE